METLQITKKVARRWASAGSVIALAGAVALVPSYQARKKAGGQEKNVTAANAADQSTSLSDQTELAVTVYNSNLALVRDVRQLTLPSGESLAPKFMDIAASVNPATVHFRSLTEPAKAERPRAELRVRSARAEQAAAEISSAAK